MKTKYTFTKLTCLLFALMTCGLVTGQGVDNNYGSSNNAGHTGGITWIGDSGGFHLSLDNNEVQSRFGTAANTLYLNYYGGDVDMLGSSNPTGDLMVDFNGLYYDNSADRVGIGTASPGQKLEVNITGQDGITINGDDTGDARLYIENGGGNHYLFDDDSDSHTLKLESGVSRALAFNTNGVNERMRITSTGNVGIGTSTPSAELHVDGSNEVTRFSGSNKWLAFYNAANTTRQAYIYYFDGGSEFRLENDLNGPLTLRTNSSERLRILGTGEVGVGTTAPEAQFHVLDTGGDAGRFGSAGGGLPGFLHVDMPTGASNNYTQRWRVNGNSVAYMETTASTYQFTVFGDALASGGNWVNSDANLKNNISELGVGALEKVMQLKPSSYTYKTDGEYAFLNLPETNQIGFIAQELKNVYPEFVKESEIVNSDHDANTTHNLHSVNYAAMVPVLTKAIQEQQELIKALEARIEALEK